MKFDAFIGGSNPSGSPNVDLEHTVNLYLEMAGEGASAPKARNVLYARPGLQLLGTLPTSPVRGTWSNNSRMFAVAGSKLYEVFAQQGTCSTNGTAVTWTSGTQFDNTNGAAGNTITIAGVSYTVASYTDATHLTLTSSAGTQAGAVFTAATYFQRGDVGTDGFPVQIFANGNQLLIVSAGFAYCDNGAGPVQASFGSALSGTVNIVNQSGHSIVNWVSGDQFVTTMAGETITINGVNYTVNPNFQITPTQLHLTTAPGGTLDPVAYSCTPGLGAGVGAFLDGFFVVADIDSKQFNFSAINDGTSWDPTDYDTKSAYPDNITGMLADHEEL